MKAQRTPLTLVTVVALASVAILAFGATSLLASPSAQITKRITLAERIAGQQFVDVGKKGPSVGDHNVVRSDALDASGKVVGRIDLDCTITGVAAHMGGLCTGVLTLPGGQLVSTFAWDGTGSATKQAITGGTGAYEDARGQMVVDVNGTDKHERFTVELVG